jgi:hypothetical protein
MTAQSYYVYLRGLRQVDHTVFCVEKGQKTYYDPVFGRYLPYSSGQQVKRSILDELSGVLGEQRAPITFNLVLSAPKGGRRELSDGEPWSPCDPTYADQLVGGWMRASKDAREGAPVKRRSPLSISALRPIHPTLAGTSSEIASFDRSDHPEQHHIRVTDDKGKEISHEEFIAYMRSENRNVPMRKWIPSDQVGPRASGLFVYDVAIDLRTLFSVSLNEFEPEVAGDMVLKLEAEGWRRNAAGTRLDCPAGRRTTIIPALAHSLISWRVTSNQSRTYSPQNTLAIAISDDASRLAVAIRTELREDSDFKKAEPVLERIDGAALYVSSIARAYVREVAATNTAIDEAEGDLVARLESHDYD